MVAGSRGKLGFVDLSNGTILACGYRKAMGWDPESGQPKDDTLERLGLKSLVDKRI